MFPKFLKDILTVENWEKMAIIWVNVYRYMSFMHRIFIQVQLLTLVNFNVFNGNVNVVNDTSKSFFFYC